MDKDLISRSTAIKIIDEMGISDCTDVEDIIGKACELVAQIPTIDAVPVIRCKDCANTDLAVCLPDGIFYCNEWNSTTRGHWYCCRGEQKEEKEND